jgi:hypothetical protein
MRFAQGRLAAAAMAAAAALACVSGAAAQAASPALTCPSSGAGCFYGQPNFNDNIGVFYPDTGQGHLKGIVGVRNRTSYWLCLYNPGNGAKWAQGPNNENSNIGGGWNTVTATLYFAGSSVC